MFQNIIISILHQLKCNKKLNQKIVKGSFRLTNNSIKLIQKALPYKIFPNLRAATSKMPAWIIAKNFRKLKKANS